MQRVSGAGLARLAAGKLRMVNLLACRGQQTGVSTEKIEVFIDNRRVLVEPGTTILQVC